MGKEQLFAPILLLLRISLLVIIFVINLDWTEDHCAIIRDSVTMYPSVNVSGITNIVHAVELGTGMQIIKVNQMGIIVLLLRGI